MHEHIQCICIIHINTFVVVSNDLERHTHRMKKADQRARTPAYKKKHNDNMKSSTSHVRNTKILLTMHVCAAKRAMIVCIHNRLYVWRLPRPTDNYMLLKQPYSVPTLERVIYYYQLNAAHAHATGFRTLLVAAAAFTMSLHTIQIPGLSLRCCWRCRFGRRLVR